jgi:hypothetical protein
VVEEADADAEGEAGHQATVTKPSEKNVARKPRRWSHAALEPTGESRTITGQFEIDGATHVGKRQSGRQPKEERVARKLSWALSPVQPPRSLASLDESKFSLAQATQTPKAALLSADFTAVAANITQVGTLRA